MIEKLKIYDEESAEVEELISLHELPPCQLSVSHLRLLLRTGKLKGKKIGRDWFTTQKAIDEYLQLGIKRGPKTTEQETSVS